ncbi:MAG: DR2241 family protein, partial [Verrucomicrobiota bacterium]
MNLKTLERWLAAGGGLIGQVSVVAEGKEFVLKHADDQATESLIIYQKWQDAHEISKLDSSGAYRPLKSASNLRTGWLMKLGSSREVLAALDVFYPAAVGMWANRKTGSLRVQSMMDTLE